jgi:pimeloyl-ACP methyl ester carboxylesterase
VPAPVFYLIPGLAADERIFRNLQPLLQGTVVVLQWITPYPNEQINHYAQRLSQAIPAEQECWVVGVSFGGTMALEICRMRPQARAVLISSIPDADSLPPLLRLIRATGVYKLVPPQLLKLFPRAGQWYFGIKNGEEYKLFKEILRDMEPTYTRWAIHRLLHWDSTGVGRCLQILGTVDPVFPPGPAPVDYLIQGGSHFMVLSHAAKIAQILNNLATDPQAAPVVAWD